MELLDVLVELLLGHIEGDVVHRAMRGDDLAVSRPVSGGRDTRRRLGCVREPEEGERVAVAHIEEEVLAHAAGELDRLHQRHPEDVAVELHRALHVAADERQMVDPAELELVVAAGSELWLRHRGPLQSSTAAGNPSRIAHDNTSRVYNHDDSPRQVSAQMHEGVFVRSVYFMDPDGILLEFASWTKILDPKIEVRHEPATAEEARSPVPAAV